MQELFENEVQSPEKKKSGKIFLAVFLAILVLSCAAITIILLFPGGKLTPLPNTAPEETETVPITVETVEMDDELRGVYIASVSNINFPSKPGLDEATLKKELNAIVANCRSIGFDTIFFQVRPMADALYRSSLFPTSRFLVKNEGDPLPLDPLQYLIDEASELGMDVVAWVNPYRVTNYKKDTKEEALASLSDSHPAKHHPDWTVFFDGKLYFDPSSKEVRNLIADGVKEICEGYKVKGILYDDYFYPYPVEGKVFDDQLKYTASSSVLSLADWRRDNVNQMVRLSYDTVKSVSSDLIFGVAPFGIWKNSSSDPAGSNTKGMEAYSAIYCDAVAWINGGYLDYIAPQIYWETGDAAADFSTLTRWWSAQVDGTGVKLYISHAAYKAENFELGGQELAEQIRYSRAYMGVCGNIQYGYADIVKNTAELKTCLKKLYEDPYLVSLPTEKVSGVVFRRPDPNFKTGTAAQFIMASSDPDFPVYLGASKIGRTKSGFFSYLMPLKEGSNTITFQQNDQNYSLQVNRTVSQSVAQLSSFQIKSFSPSAKEQVVVSSGGKLPLSVTAPAGCTVKVTLDQKSVTLRPTLNPVGSGTYLKEEYIGEISVPQVESGKDYVLVGSLEIDVNGYGSTLHKTGASVFVIPSDLDVMATVTEDYTYLKQSVNSSFYDDFTPSSVGMEDSVTGIFDDYVRLESGMFVSKDSVRIEKGMKREDSHLQTIRATSNSNVTQFHLTLNAAPPITVDIKGEKIRIKLFRTDLIFNGSVSLPKEDHLFSNAEILSVRSDQATTLILTLRDPMNYYGFDYRYENGILTVSFRQPQALSKGDKPLEGKTVLLDAGHGGNDCGALGYLDHHNEADLNLSVILALKTKLSALGANVVLSRSEDVFVTLEDRMALLTKTNPDFSVSVHHNSTAETKDANSVHGTLGLYWSQAGISLSHYVQQGALSATQYSDSGIQSQKLAVCRNHRFPQTLVEVGYMCSPAEFQFAMSEDYSDTVSEGIKEGILNWYRMQEERMGQTL